MKGLKIEVLLLLVFVVSIFSCVPPKEDTNKNVKIDFADTTLRHILDLQDRRMTDSIVEYLDNPNPTYRYIATNAFGSIKAKNYANAVVKRLRDENKDVREIAAFAIGQIGNATVLDSLIAVYGKYDTTNYDNVFNSNILEAVGKIGDLNSLKNLSTISTFRPTDTLLMLGQARGLYQYLLRGMSTPEGTEKIIDNIGGTYPKELKVISSYYFLKAKNKDLNNYTYRLTKLFERESDPNIKMNIAIGLGKTKNPEVLKILKKSLNSDNTDNGVKINIIKALQNFNYSDVIEIILPEIENPNWQIAFNAANYIYNYGQPKDVAKYRKYAKKDLNWRAKSMLYRAIVKHVPLRFKKTKGATISEIKKHIQNSENQFEKAQYILALGENIDELKSVYELGFKAPEIVSRTAAMEAILLIARNKNIENLSKNKLKKLKKYIANIILEAFNSNDSGAIYYAASILQESNIDWKNEFEDFKFVDECKAKLKSPKDIEAIMEIEKLQAKWNGKDYIPPQIGYNNPIDWGELDTTASNPIAIIETNKGNFEIELLKNKAPGTVINFIKLIKNNYYEGKKIHRVEPNFVIQTGCNRGDGFGSLDVTIRSEFSDIHYSESGFVGMASAGKDTESMQWFVTLAPTPHLNGKYTIFGKIISGYKNIEKLEIGDIINKIVLK